MTWEGSASTSPAAAGSTSSTRRALRATAVVCTARQNLPACACGEKDWGEHVESFSVGPTAYVQCFDADHFDDTVFWLLPSQSLANVDELDCPAGVDTFRVFDRPPFAYEPGYAAYMLWAASHLARMKE